jgi:hypothetical protein
MLNKVEQVPQSDVEQQEKMEHRVENKETEGALVEKAKVFLADAFASVAKTFLSAEEFGDDEVLSAQEQQEEDMLVQETSKAFQRLYLAIKETLGDAPLSLLLKEGSAEEGPDMQPDSPSFFKRIAERRDVPLAAAFIDLFAGSSLSETYQKCVDFKKARMDGQMTQEEIDFKEQLSQRVSPFNYESDLSSMKGVSDTIRSGLKRLRDINEGDGEIYTKEDVDLLTVEGERMRFDLFRKYLGLEQFYAYIQQSPYRPSMESDKNAEYFTFSPEVVVNSICRTAQDAREISASPPEFFSKAALEILYCGTTFDELVKFTEEFNELPPNQATNQLGKYKAYSGYDKARGERYVSYYDLWDLDPPQLKLLGVDIDQFNFPFELYGRIYESDFDQYSFEEEIKEPDPKAAEPEGETLDTEYNPF